MTPKLHPPPSRKHAVALLANQQPAGRVEIGVPKKL